MNIELKKELSYLIKNENFIRAVFSSPFDKKGKWGEKVNIRPLSLKKQKAYQFTYQVGPQSFHLNFTEEEALVALTECIDSFKQGQIQTVENDFHLLHGRKGITYLKKPPTQSILTLSHNRAKAHLLPEGTPDAYLIGLGLMNSAGKIIPAKSHKFKQINRYLEMVDDAIQGFDSRKKMNIVDLGCGKAYLTFALYHYLKEIKQWDVSLTGVDLKNDVLKECERLAKQLRYDDLRFYSGDIDSFFPENQIDMVLSLHACNTATDGALAKGIQWNASILLAVPCCQHELYSQINNPSLDSLLRHGILKERFAALVTDAARADLLEKSGYKTDVFEFIDLEHSPKNLMIRGIKKPSALQQQKGDERYQLLKETLKIQPTLEKLLLT